MLGLSTSIAILSVLLYVWSRRLLRGDYDPFCYIPVPERALPVHIKAAGSVALLVPMTSRSERARIEDAMSSSSLSTCSARLLRTLLPFRVLYPSLIDTVDRNRSIVGLFIGLHREDLLATRCRDAFERATRAATAAAVAVVVVVVHNHTRLVDMYNSLSREAFAYKASHNPMKFDYFMIANDDLRFDSPNWPVRLSRSLAAAPIANFGTIGPHEYWNGCHWCANYNMVARQHLQAFNGRIYDDFFDSYGIDVHLCALYAACQKRQPHANAVAWNVRVTNHVDDTPRRYNVSRRSSEWRRYVADRVAAAIAVASSDWKSSCFG